MAVVRRARLQAARIQRRRRRQWIGPATRSQRVALGIPSETDTAFSITHSKRVNLGIPSETDTASSVRPAKGKTLGIPSETDTAFSIAHSKRVNLSLVSEADSALSIKGQKRRALGIATTEADTAFSIGHAKGVSLGFPSSANTAFSITHAKRRNLGVAGETDTAPKLVFTQTRILGIATIEVDVAYAICPSGGRNIRRICLTPAANSAHTLSATPVVPTTLTPFHE